MFAMIVNHFLSFLLKESRNMSSKCYFSSNFRIFSQGHAAGTPDESLLFSGHSVFISSKLLQKMNSYLNYSHSKSTLFNKNRLHFNAFSGMLCLTTSYKEGVDAYGKGHLD